MCVETLIKRLTIVGMVAAMIAPEVSLANEDVIGAATSVTETSSAAATTEPAAEPARKPLRRRSLRRRSSSDAAVVEAAISQPTAAELQQREDNQTRRTMMKWHQGLGLATNALVLAQAAVGTPLFFQDEFCPNCTAKELTEYIDPIRSTHLALGISSFVTWSAAGVLAIAAPETEASEREYDEVSRVDIHRWLALGHTVGMVTLPVVGMYITNPDLFGEKGKEFHAENLEGMRAGHAYAGYLTTVLITSAMFTILF